MVRNIIGGVALMVVALVMVIFYLLEKPYISNSRMVSIETQGLVVYKKHFQELYANEPEKLASLGVVSLVDDAIAQINQLPGYDIDANQYYLYSSVVKEVNYSLGKLAEKHEEFVAAAEKQFYYQAEQEIKRRNLSRASVNVDYYFLEDAAKGLYTARGYFEPVGLSYHEIKNQLHLNDLKYSILLALVVVFLLGALLGGFRQYRLDLSK